MTFRTRTFRSLALRLGTVALGLTLHACNVAGAQSAPRGTAVVDLAALLRVHPFAPALQQYDREIEALSSTALTAGSARTTGELRAAESGFARERSESSLVWERLRAHSVEFEKRENDQLAALAAAPAEASAGVRSALNATYRVQSSDIRARAASSYAQYQSSLTRQRGDALSALQASLDASLRRADAANSQRLAERESDATVALISANAAERLNLRLRLRNTYLGANRAAIVARLSALDRQQQDALARERARNGKTLATQHAALQAHNDAEFSSLSTGLDRKIAANAAERKAVYAAQANPPRVPDSVDTSQPDVDLNTEARDFRAAGAPRASDAVTPALQSASAVVTRNVTRLEAADRDSRTRTDAEIGALRRARAELVRAMRAQILRLARDEAKGRTVVETPAGTVTNGAVDVTPAVATDLKRLSL